MYGNHEILTPGTRFFLTEIVFPSPEATGPDVEKLNSQCLVSGFGTRVTDSGQRKSDFATRIAGFWCPDEWIQGPAIITKASTFLRV